MERRGKKWEALTRVEETQSYQKSSRNDQLNQNLFTNKNHAIRERK